MIDLTTNVVSVNERIAKEITRLIDNAFKSGLSKAASKIKRKAWQILKSRIKSDSYGASAHGRAVWSDTLKEGVRRTKVKESPTHDDFWVMSTINAAGKNSKTSGAFRLHILDEGATNAKKKPLKTRGFWSEAERSSNVDFGKSVSDACKKAQTKIDEIMRK